MSRIASALCITHTSASEHLTHLAPFAVWTALPPSDYYGASVTLGVSPFRQSRVPSVVDVQAAVGAPFMPLRSLQTIPLPRACRRRRSFTPGEAITAVNRCSRAVSFTGWALGFKQSSLHRGDRVSTGLPLGGFAVSCLPAQAVVPLAFAGGLYVPPGKCGDPRVSRSTPPVLHGDQTTPLRGAPTQLRCGAAE
jgi:hypothetical protein